MSYVFPIYDSDTRPEVWKPVDIIALLYQPGFMSPNDWRPITMCAVIMGESGGDPIAVSKVNWSPGKPTHLSLDLGLFQLNSYYHTVTGPFPDVPPLTVAQCFDPFVSWEQAWKVMNKGRTGWSYNMVPWHAFTNGSYDKHVSAARAGMLQYREIMGLGIGPFA